MKIFISWSGERSKMVANALKSWLEKFFQTVEVFMSESDIEPVHVGRLDLTMNYKYQIMELFA